MAAPAEKSLSVGHRTQSKENTFTKQDVRSRAMHLRLYLQELKDRECRAQEHNSQLLQQFEEAQDALREMLARTAAMKTIRMEYERYLEENSSRWQQQLQEQTQAAQIKQRIDDSLKAYLKKTEEKQVLASTVGRPLLSPGPSNPKSVPPPQKSDYHQDNSSDPYAQSSWLTSSFLTASHQSHNAFLPTPHIFLHPHSLPPRPFTPSHHQLWSRQDDAGGDPGISPEEPPAPTGEEHEETSSNRERDGGSRSRLSPDLDIKPVRLLSGQAESSESDGDSSLVSREKKKRQNSDSESHGSQKTSNKMTTASFLPQSSESDTSSEQSSSVPVMSLQSEEEESRCTHEEEGSSDEEFQSEKVEERSHAEESESRGAEQGSGRSNTAARAEEETDDREQSSIGGKDGDEQKNSEPEDGEETENSQEEQGSEEDVCIKGKTEEGAEVRMEDQGAFSQDEEAGSESSEDEEGSHDEDQGEESGDSDDVIISPQNKRPEQIQIIPEAAEDEEDKTQSSDDVSDEDIESLLAPQEQTEEKELQADEEPKVIHHNMDIFQVAKEKSKLDNRSDSEFDHFYD